MRSVRNRLYAYYPSIVVMSISADVIIVNQAIDAARCGPSAIREVSDDTDVFLLLCHFYLEEKLTCDLVPVNVNQCPVWDAASRVCADVFEFQ